MKCLFTIQIKMMNILDDKDAMQKVEDILELTKINESGEIEEALDIDMTVDTTLYEVKDDVTLRKIR